MISLKKSPILSLMVLSVICSTTQTAHVEISFLEFSNAVTSNNYSPSTYNRYKLFTSGLSRGHIKTKEEAAMALAQILYQTRGLKAKREVECVQSNCPTLYRNSDCDHRGQYYYGRGYLHLKGCLNYKEASEDLFDDHRLVHHPDLVATNETIAWQTAFWYWGRRVHHHGGRSGKFGATTKAISPEECRGVLPSVMKRFEIYENVRSAFGLRRRGNPNGCYPKPSLPRLGGR